MNMASIDGLTDSEIRIKLTELGYPVYPVTATTRKVLLKKLKSLLEQSNLVGHDTNEFIRPTTLSRYRPSCEGNVSMGARNRRILHPKRGVPGFGTSNTFGSFNKPETSFRETSTVFDTSGGSLFATTSQPTTAGLLGATTQPFGQPPTISSLGFSTTVAAAANTGSGTLSYKFVVVMGTDTIVSGGVSSIIGTRHHCITCMKEYETKSLEELRLEDYCRNAVFRTGPRQGVQSIEQPFEFRDGGSSTATRSSLFGSTENKPLFNQTNTSIGFSTTVAAAANTGSGTLSLYCKLVGGASCSKTMSDTTNGKLPQVGSCFGGESHSSSEDCPLDSGEGNTHAAELERRTGAELSSAGGVVEGADAFSRSGMTFRSPPAGGAMRLPTGEDLERMQVAVAEGELSLDMSAGQSMEEGASLDSGMPSFMDVEEGESEDVVLDYNLRLPPNIKRQLVREKKMAEGTWVKPAEWKKAQGQKPRLRFRKKTADAPGIDVQGPSGTGRAGGKRPRSPADRGEEGRARPRPTYRDQVVGIKMVVVPTAFPEAKFTEDQAESIKDLLTEILLETTKTGEVRPQIIRASVEGGALTVTCADEASREWLRGTADKLALEEGDGGSHGVIIGDYKDILRSTKVFLKTPESRVLARLDPKEILQQISDQNAGIDTDGWRVVSSKKDGKQQTIIFIADEMSAQELKARGWRIFLGLARLQLRTLGGHLHDGPRSSV